VAVVDHRRGGSDVQGGAPAASIPRDRPPAHTAGGRSAIALSMWSASRVV